MNLKNLAPVVLCFVLTSASLFAQKQPLRLHYDKPAANWEQTLPLGNGRLGMMPNSDISDEKIVLNDITLWSGSVQDANNYDAYKKLPEIRELLLAGKNVEAQNLIDKDFVCKGPGSGGRQWVVSRYWARSTCNLITAVPMPQNIAITSASYH